MDLDKRIKNNHRPLCVIDIKWAMGFVGKNGFFADAINCFENLSECQSGLLISVKDKKLHPFECDNQWNYTFFIPEEWVKEPEKKYRPFSLDEFLKIFDIGDQIDFKGKGCCDEVKVAMFTGYITDVDRTDDETPGAVDLMLGCFHYSLLDLFKDYELFLDDKWQPFGVIDE